MVGADTIDGIGTTAGIGSTAGTAPLLNLQYSAPLRKDEQACDEVVRAFFLDV